MQSFDNFVSFHHIHLKNPCFLELLIISQVAQPICFSRQAATLSTDNTMTLQMFEYLREISLACTMMILEISFDDIANI